MSLSRFQRWMNLLATLKYALVMLALLIYLPLTAFSRVPGSSLLGGLFAELDETRILWATAGFFAGAWTLMICSSLVIDCARRLGQGDSLPAAAVRYFALPVTKAHFAASTALAILSTLLVVIVGDHEGASGWLKAVTAGVLGWALTYSIAVVLALPAQLAEDSDSPVWQGRVARGLLATARAIPGVQALAHLWLRLATRVTRFLRLGYLLDGERLSPGHFLAATYAVGTYLVLKLATRLFFPDHPWFGFGGERLADLAPGAAPYVYILLVLLAWTLLGLGCHLARFRWSPVILLLVIMLVVYRIDRTDHYFAVEPDLAPRTDFDPVSIAAASRAPRNLVVVTSAGGGILAAGWGNLALAELVTERPELAHEMRLLSAISGGSVGAAFYAVRVADTATLPAQRDDRRRFLENVYRDSVHPSLAAVGYGFALIDFWRIFGGPILNRDLDRGILLEHAWRRRYGGLEGGEVTLRELDDAVEDGRVPALILGSTVMETGRRLMLTSIDFGLDPAERAELERTGELSTRALTLSEFIDPSRGAATDISVWTAARMSASFAWVSPAARARDFDGGAELRGLHVIDGGYFDNFGVTSALDWLEKVLAARLAGDTRLAFERVLVIRLNTFPRANPLEVTPVDGALSAVLGPVLGLAGIQGGTAISRDAIDLHRWQEGWSERFAEAGVPVCLDHVELRPTAAMDQPLSWRLTPSQIAEQKRVWQESAGDFEPGALGSELEKAYGFLDGSIRCSATATPADEAAAE